MVGMPEAVPFSLCGGHPALDFVNTLDYRFRADGPHALLGEYGDLLRFMEQSRLLDTAQVKLLAQAVSKDAAERSLHSARELREAAAAALYGSVDGAPPQPAQIRVLERHFLSAGRHQELRWVEPPKRSGERPGIAWERLRFQSHADLPVWLLSEAVSGLMLSAAIHRLRSCGIETCRWLFLDTSKNHTRRWCDMKVCGNRM